MAAFSIISLPFGKIFQVQLRNNRSGEYVSVLPSFGATINELVLKKADKFYSVVAGYSNYEDLLTDGRKRFRGSKLFPFPNRIKDGQYGFQGKKYQLYKNHIEEGHALHGLVLEADFQISEQKVNDEKAEILLTYENTGDNKGYPFSFRLEILFTLSEEGFLSQTKITNTSSIDIPVGDGWHPYFTIGSEVDKLFLKIPSSAMVELDERMIPTGKKINSTHFLKPEKISSTLFDSCYVLNGLQNHIAETVLRDEEKNLELLIWQETGAGKYNYLQIYIPPDRKSIALEPMTCLPDAFNNKEGLIILAAGQSMKTNFGVKLK